MGMDYLEGWAIVQAKYGSSCSYDFAVLKLIRTGFTLKVI